MRTERTRRLSAVPQEPKNRESKKRVRNRNARARWGLPTSPPRQTWLDAQRFTDGGRAVERISVWIYSEGRVA